MVSVHPQNYQRHCELFPIDAHAKEIAIKNTRCHLACTYQWLREMNTPFRNTLGIFLVLMVGNPNKALLVETHKRQKLTTGCQLGD